jgi:hypothetical protein
MIVIERMTQTIRNGKLAELEALDKKYDPVESRLGFPPKKRYRCLAGSQSWNTFVIERQWESMAALETTYERAMADPEHQALNQEANAVIKSVQVELYGLMP